MNKTNILTIIATRLLTIIFCIIHAASDTETEPYERFVSLGERCLVTFNINCYLGVITDNPVLKDLSEKTVFPTAGEKAVSLNDDLEKRKPHFWGGYPFDWVRVENYDAFIDFIDRDFTNPFEKEHLELFLEEQNQVVRDKLNGICRRHFVFSRVLSENGEIIQQAWDEEHKRCHQKIDYLIEKFRNLRQYKTLYVVATSLPNDHDWSLSDEQLHMLRKAIEKNRGNENFTILMCSDNIENRDIEKQIVLRKTAKLDWYTRWYWDHSLFDEFKLDPEIISGIKQIV